MSNNNVEYWSFREPEGTANIASRLVGSGDKLVAAFPGLGISGNMFDRLAEHFDGDVRFLLPDPPGHGYSGPLPSGNYHADYMAKMFHQYLSEKRNDDKISIVGFSIGGLFAMKYAAKFPEDIRSLILVSVGYDNPYLQDPKYTENVVRRYIRMWGSSDKKRDRTIDFSKLEGI